MMNDELRTACLSFIIHHFLTLDSRLQTPDFCLSLVTVLLQFPQHQVFQKDVMRGEGGDAEAGEAVAPAAFENVVAYERGRPDRRDLERCRASPLLEHLARG